MKTHTNYSTETKEFDPFYYKDHKYAFTAKAILKTTKEGGDLDTPDFTDTTIHSVEIQQETLYVYNPYIDDYEPVTDMDIQEELEKELVHGSFDQARASVTPTPKSLTDRYKITL